MICDKIDCVLENSSSPEVRKIMQSVKLSVNDLLKCREYHSNRFDIGTKNVRDSLIGISKDMNSWEKVNAKDKFYQEIYDINQKTQRVYSMISIMPDIAGE